MAIFYCKPVEENPKLLLQEREIVEACWMAPAEIAQHELTWYERADNMICRVTTITDCSDKELGFTTYGRKET